MSPRVFLVLAAAAAAIALAAGPAAAQVVDTTPPTVTFTVPSEGQVFASDQGNIPTTFSCHDDTDPNPRCDGPAFIDTTQVGEHLFTVTGTDASHNSAPQSVHYRVVDMIPPQITITVPTPNQHFPQHTAQDATFNCTDAGGSLIDTCATASALNGDTSTGIDTSTPGPHVLDVVAIDGAGNRTTMSVPYIVDPEAVIHFPSLGQAAHTGLSRTRAVLKRLRHGAPTIRLRAPRGDKVEVFVTARVHGRSVTLVDSSTGAEVDGTVKLTLHPAGKAARRVLHGHGRLRGKISVVVSDGQDHVGRASGAARF